jgi:hypothetical protein
VEGGGDTLKCQRLHAGCQSLLSPVLGHAVLHPLLLKVVILGQ